MLTKLSQVQAARAARVSRTTIWRAIKTGRLSAEPADDGSMRIDLSELLRVFPDADPQRVHEHAPDGAVNTDEQGDEHHPSAHFSALRTLLEELKADKLNRDNEAEYLRQELRHAREERERLLSMLEHKDRLFEEQAQTVRLLTDRRERRHRWFARWRKES
jgi:hypothetical protein